MADRPFLCYRLGWHRWRFVAMSARHTVDVPPHFAHLCALVERCDRCGIKRTRDHAEVPKTVKPSKWEPSPAAQDFTPPPTRVGGCTSVCVDDYIAPPSASPGEPQ